MNEEKMRLSLKEAHKCKKYSDVPVGTIIIKNQKVIAKAYNQRNKKNNSLMHAEIIAINKACKKLKNWRLEGCTMFVTLEPCPMCAGAIVQSRMDKVVYGANSYKAGSCGTILEVLQNDKLNHKVEVESGVLEEECSKLISDFFTELRQSKKLEEKHN